MSYRYSSVDELKKHLSPDVQVVGEQKAPTPIPGLKTSKSNSSTDRTRLERKFISMWTGLHLPALEQEYRFHGIRRWRADFAHLPSMTLIEIEGVNWKGISRHRTNTGFVNDAEKYFEAAMLGFTVVRLTPNMIEEETLLRLAKHIRSNC